MNVISRDELKTLSQEQEKFCVSIYMPTHRTGAEIQQGPIRLGNLIRDAEEGLVANGLRSADAKSLLGPIQALAADGFFWRHQADGLAIFVSPGLVRHYRVALDFDELVVVSDRFHLKPLLRLFAEDGRFYLLALSQNGVRLLEGTRHTVNELDLEGVPASLAEALKYDSFEKPVQFHARTAAGGRAKGAAMFHGRGGDIDDSKSEILQYFREVNKGVHDLLKDERVPLILAGVDYLFPIYREVSTYRHLLEEGISGNPEERSARELHQEAWPIVQSYFRQEQEQAIAQYRVLLGTGRASSDLREVVLAASHGRVEILFVPVGVQVWGSCNPETNELCVHDQPEPGDEDLLNYAAIQSFLNGGTVFAVEPNNMVDDAKLAAVFRY